MLKNKTFCTVHKSSGARRTECLHWIWGGNNLYLQPAGRRVKGRTHRRRKWYTGICNKGEDRKMSWHLFSLYWSCHQSKDSVHLVTPCIHLYIISSHTWTHVGFAELGTRTFNINAIPGQSEEWLLEHFHVYTELHWSMSSGNNALKWSHTSKSHTDNITHSYLSSFCSFSIFAIQAEKVHCVVMSV